MPDENNLENLEDDLSSYDAPSKMQVMGGVALLLVIAIVATGILYFNKNKATPDNSSAVIGINDADSDGLTDEQERDLGTNPQIADSDADGYSDYNEIKSGFNPMGPGRLEDASKEAKTIKDMLEQPIQPRRTPNDFINHIKTVINSYLSIRGIVYLLFWLVFFGLGVFIFGQALNFVLNKFFKISVDIERSLYIGALQSFTVLILKLFANTILFFITDFVLFVVVYLLSIGLGFVAYHYILKYFLKTSVLKNIGIIIATGIVMYIIYFSLSLIFALLLVPVFLLLSFLS